MKTRRVLILIGAVTAWLCGALVATPAPGAVTGGDARRAPGGPEPVWVGIGELGLVVSEPRERRGGDDGPSGAILAVDAFEQVSLCSAQVCGRSVAVRSHRCGAMGARSPPV